MDRIKLLLDYLIEYRKLKGTYTSAAMDRQKALEIKIDVSCYMIKKDIEDGKIK